MFAAENKNIPWIAWGWGAKNFSKERVSTLSTKIILDSGLRSVSISVSLILINDQPDFRDLLSLVRKYVYIHEFIGVECRIESRIRDYFTDNFSFESEDET